MNMEQKYKEYLGDSVYAQFDGYHIVLTTENGYEATNTIALEPAVYHALIHYRQRLLAVLNAIEHEDKSETMEPS